MADYLGGCRPPLARAVRGSKWQRRALFGGGFAGARLDPNDELEQTLVWGVLAAAGRHQQEVNDQLCNRLGRQILSAVFLAEGHTGRLQGSAQLRAIQVLLLAHEDCDLSWLDLIHVDPRPHHIGQDLGFGLIRIRADDLDLALVAKQLPFADTASPPPRTSSTSTFVVAR